MDYVYAPSPGIPWATEQFPVLKSSPVCMPIVVKRKTNRRQINIVESGLKVPDY